MLNRSYLRLGKQSKIHVKALTTCLTKSSKIHTLQDIPIQPQFGNDLTNNMISNSFSRSRFLSGHFLVIILTSWFLITSSANATRSEQVEYPTYYAHVNDISIAYQEFGDPEHETILLVMGLGGQLIHWDDDMVWAFVDAGYHVIRYDNRDAGWSTKFYREDTPGIITGVRYKLGMSLGSPYKLDDMAADAIGLLDYLEVKTAHVVGMSMGGMIAQIVAAQNPTRIKTLTSIMSTSGDENLPEGSVTLDMPGGSIPTREQAMANSATIGQQIDGSSAELTEQEWRKVASRSYDRSSYPDGVARQLWAILDSGDRINLLSNIQQPSLVIHGKEDTLIPVEHGRHTGELIKNSRVVLVDGMGHYIDRVNKPLIVKEIIDLANRSSGIATTQ